MRPLIPSTVAVLAACALVAGCGSSSSHPSNNYNSRLSGTYVFEQQLYTHYSGVATLSRRSPLMRQLAQNALNRTASLHRPFQHLVAGATRPIADQGSDPNQTGVVWGAMAGSLTFDGKGNVTGGEIDFNEPEVGYFHDTVSGVYNINKDNSGSIQIVSKQQNAPFFFDIALQGTGSVATGAQMVESLADDFGNVEIGTGTMVQQSGGLSSGSLNGNYVFGLQGETCYGCGLANVGDLYAAGLLAANGSGGFGTASEADVATVFQTDNLVPLVGNYNTPDASGRATMTLVSGGVIPQKYVAYIANPGLFFLLAADTSSSTAPAWLFGQARLQNGTFSNSTLNGNYVLAENTEDLRNENTPDFYSDAMLARLSAQGGAFSGTGDMNKAGNVIGGVNFNYGSYNVDSNGRATFTGATPAGAPAPVIWLQNASFGFGVDQLRGNSTAQEPGLIRLYGQVGSGFSASSLSGYYALGTLPAATSNSLLFLGVVTSDGSANLSGSGVVSFFSNDGGSGASGTTNGNYTISASGRGTVTGTNSSIFGNGVLYVVGPTGSLMLDATPGEIAPTVQVFSGNASGLGCTPWDPRC